MQLIRSMWFVSSVLVVALVSPTLGDATQPLSANSTEALIEAVRSSVCRIKVYDEHGVSFAQGTGFLVAPTRVATCHHVIAGAVRASATFQNATSIAITQVVAQDKDRDLVVVSLEQQPEGVRPLSLAELAVPKQGAAVIALGYPLSLALTVSQGIITALPTGADLNRSIGETAFSEGDRLIQTDAAISPGNSGGPLIDAQGRALAVMALIRRGGSNLGFGIPCAYLQTLLHGSESPQPLSNVKPHAIGWNFGSPVLPPRVQKVSLSEITNHVGRLIRITQCRYCRGGGLLDVRVVGERGSDWYEKKRCPTCGGRGYLRTNDEIAYQIMAEMAEPLVYLDTQATVVQPSQASAVRDAIMKVVDRVSKTKIPAGWVAKAARSIREAKGEEARGVCFVARITSKVTSGGRDYLIADVVGDDVLVVAIVTDAGKYEFNPKGGKSDFDPDGSYLVGGVAVGRIEGSSNSAFNALVWPAFMVRPGVVYYARNAYGYAIPVGYAPRTFFIPIDALDTGEGEEPMAKKGYITLD